MMISKNKKTLRVFVSVFVGLVVFFLHRDYAWASPLCNDTYSGYGMGCRVLDDCSQTDYAKTKVKEAWEAKKIGGYKGTYGGVQAGDFYLTNIYKADGSVELEICPLKQMGEGIQVLQVCCMFKGAPDGGNGGGGDAGKWCYDEAGKACSLVVAGGSCISGKLYTLESECKSANPPATSGDTSTAPTTDNGSSFIPGRPPGYNGPLPDCAFEGSCRNVNDVLELMVNWGQRIFGLIGSFALVMFVYGGFVMIFSAGNAEKVKQGRDILTAAVIGLVIAFSAYLLVDFILDALNVREEFRGVNL